MNKLLSILAAVSVTATVASAQTNQVLSRNAVGYTKTSIRTNQLALIRNDFNSLQLSMTVSNVIGDQVPVGSSLLLWNYSTFQYVSEIKLRGGWSPGTSVLFRGRSFFVKVPVFGGVVTSNEYQLFLTGEVPDRFTAPTTTFNNVTGLGMYGDPYPAPNFWLTNKLAVGASVSDQLLLWNQSIQNYESHTRLRSGWTTASNIVINPGQGYFYRTTNTVQWVEVKPYTWP